MGKGASTTQESKSTTEIPAEVRNRGTRITNAAMSQYMDPAKKNNVYNFGKYRQQGENRTGQLNQYHDMAGQNFQDAGNSYQPYLNRADTTATDSAAANNAQGMNGPDYSYANLQKFQNPYDEAVLNTGLRKIGDAYTQGRLGIQSRAANVGAFGGTRRAVEDSLNANNAMTNINDFIGSQLQQGYQNAQNQFNTDFSQQAQATGVNNAAAQQNWAKDAALSQIYSNLGQQTQGQQLAAGQAQMGLGNYMTARDQAARDNAFATYQYQDQRPMNIYSQLADINRLQPVNRTSSSTGTSSQDPGSGAWIGPTVQALGSVAMMASDERAKEDITPLDPEDVLGAFAGVPTYSYRYKDEAREVLGDTAGEGQRRGFMAQDLEKSFGRKSGPTINGYKTVDTHNLIGDLVAAVKGLEKRTRGLKRA